MRNETDKELIEKYISHCATLGLTADGLAALVRRTRAWGSMLLNGEIKRLQFQTRVRIERVLDNADANSSVGAQA
jgi:hypothetical protein